MSDTDDSLQHPPYTTGDDSDESDTRSETPLPKVQDCKAQGQAIPDLQKQKTQTEARIVLGTNRMDILGLPCVSPIT
jgi:hypothetical protein